MKISKEEVLEVLGDICNLNADSGKLAEDMRIYDRHKKESDAMSKLAFKGLCSRASQIHTRLRCIQGQIPAIRDLMGI